MRRSSAAWLVLGSLSCMCGYVLWSCRVYFQKPRLDLGAHVPAAAHAAIQDWHSNQDFESDMPFNTKILMLLLTDPWPDRRTRITVDEPELISPGKPDRKAPVKTSWNRDGSDWTTGIYHLVPEDDVPDSSLAIGTGRPLGTSSSPYFMMEVRHSTRIWQFSRDFGELHWKYVHEIKFRR